MSIITGNVLRILQPTLIGAYTGDDQVYGFKQKPFNYTYAFISNYNQDIDGVSFLEGDGGIVTKGRTETFELDNVGDLEVTDDYAESFFIEIDTGYLMFDDIPPAEKEIVTFVTTNTGELGVNMFSNTHQVTCDWGDGTTEVVNPGYFTHTYTDSLPEHTVKLEAENTTTLTIRNEKVNSIDVSKLTNLQILALPNNNLSSIDVSKNEKLVEIYVQQNPLTALDLSKNLLLEILYTYETNLTSLDISANTKIYETYSDDSQLTSLIISPNHTALNDFSSMGNAISDLTEIFHNLDLAGVQDGYADFTGGTNAAPTPQGQAYITNLENKGWDIYTNAPVLSYTTERIGVVTTIFKISEGETTIDFDNGSSYTYSSGYPRTVFSSYTQAGSPHTITFTGGTVEELNVSNGDIISVTLLSGTGLKSLELDNNKLSKLDISKNTKLILLSCVNNSITEVSEIDTILANLDSFGLSNGEVHLEGGTNAIPSAQGLVYKTNLENKQWQVTVNQ